MTHPRAIGGVFPAEQERANVAGSIWSAWSSGWPHSAAYRTARSALAAVVEGRRVLLPDYACTALSQASPNPLYYPVDSRLNPDLSRLEPLLRRGDAVVAIAYFGRSPPADFRALAASRPDILWIEDRAQALSPDAPPWADIVLYSPRKLLGVADGGLVFSRQPLAQPDPSPDDAALWAPEDARAADPDGAAPQSWYPLFQAREAAFAVDRAPMSARAKAALQSVEIAPIIAARQANWRTLAQRLGAMALWPDFDPTFAPLTFPILTRDAVETVQTLAAQRIWCPRHWAGLPGDISPRLVSLPCDQRYNETDMHRLADAVLIGADIDKGTVYLILQN